MYFYLYSQSKFIGFSWIQMMCHFCSTGRDQKVVENFLSALDCPPNRFFSRCMWVTKYPQLHHCRRDPLFYLNIIQKMKGEWYNQEGASPHLSSLSSSLHFSWKDIILNLFRAGGRGVTMWEILKNYCGQTIFPTESSCCGVLSLSGT